MTAVTFDQIRLAQQKLDAAGVPRPYMMWHPQFGLIKLDREVVDSVLMTPRKMQ